MKLARVHMDGVDLVVAVENDELVVVGEGGQELLLKTAMHRDESRWDGRVMPVDEKLTFLAPVPHPPSFRDFFAFEAHMLTSRASAGQEPDPAWYERPVFYFSNPAAIVGPEAVIKPPAGTRALDYELEVAAVVGREVADLDEDDPSVLDCLAGFTILNDWSARDIQGREMSQSLGPQKAKDFATSIGPWVATLDEFEIEDGRPAARMRASVNGETWSQGEMSDIHYSWPRILAYASQDTRLRPGDLLGSGTCGTGCILELRMAGMRDTRHWLREGDVVELNVDGLGSLVNEIGPAAG